MKHVAMALLAFALSACVTGDEAPTVDLTEADSAPTPITQIPDDPTNEPIVSDEMPDDLPEAEIPGPCTTCAGGSRAEVVRTSIGRWQALIGTTALQQGWSAVHHIFATAASKRDCQTRGWAGGVYLTFNLNTLEAYEICYRGTERVVSGALALSTGVPCDGVNFGADHWLFCNAAGSRVPPVLGLGNPGFVVEHGAGSMIISVPEAATRFTMNIDAWAEAYMGMDLDLRDGWQSFRATRAAHDVCQTIYRALGGYLVEYDASTGAGQLACIYR